MQMFKKLLFLLTPPERKRAGLLIVAIIIMALLEMLGVASILPFIAVLANPILIETNIVLSAAFQALSMFGVKTNQDFFLALGVLVFVLLVLSLTVKIFTTYVRIHFVQMLEYSVSKRLIEGYLRQPYSWFLARHSADLGKTILSEVNQVISLGISTLIELISGVAVAIALITLLIVFDPKIAFVVGLSLTMSYALIFNNVRKYLKQNGEKRLKNNQLRFIALSEVFGAIKEVKVGGLEEIYIKNYSNYAQIFASHQASASTIAQLPRFLLEAIAFGGILIILLYSMMKTNSFNNTVPIISLYAFAGYRLLPALQQIYSSFTNFAFVGPSLNKLHDDIKSLKPLYENQDQGVLPLSKTIVLNNVRYSYPNSARTALKDINLTISAKSTVGIVGATGSGKTTTADIILSLLAPQKGTLEVDGQVISMQNARSWQKSIGYVPQHIFLSDSSLASNIAFGVEPKDICQQAVETAAKIANLHNFIIEELPHQYQTVIGERGVRLSGGQRQRIGVARALYHNPQILILDEATSALDNQTEKAVMDAISNLRQKITIILIAHRLTTVKNCDIIFLLDKGQVKDKGTFKELMQINDKFRENAKVQ
jgi:ABC-type bacteriocin/lantibiotic exporter with double-glycine peptidase domain